MKFHHCRHTTDLRIGKEGWIPLPFFVISKIQILTMRSATAAHTGKCPKDTLNCFHIFWIHIALKQKIDTYST